MNRWLIVGGMCLFASSLWATDIVESERTMPLVQDADVAVAGGSCGALAAAEAENLARDRTFTKVIDEEVKATGNADVAAAAGEETEFRQGNRASEPYILIS